MHLHHVRDALDRDLRRPSAIQRFRTLAASDPALSALATPHSTIALLNGPVATVHERNVVVAALVASLQRTRDPELSALLVLAFHPGLNSLCARLRRSAPRTPDGTLEALVLEAFLEVLHAFPVQTQAGSATIGIVFGTRRVALRELYRYRELIHEPLTADERRTLRSPTADPEAALLCREIAPAISFDALRGYLHDEGVLTGNAGRRLALMLGTADASASGSVLAERRANESRQRARRRLLRGEPMKNVRVRLSAFREHLPLLIQEGWQ